MALVTATPYPSLGVAVREARSHAATQDRPGSRSRTFMRRVVITLSLIFAVVGFGGGMAQAAPWDIGEDFTAYVSNICGPQDVEIPSDGTGLDNALSLNEIDTRDPDVIKTILPNLGQATKAGTGIDRLESAYPKDDPQYSPVIHPTYERYGFSSLRWTNYGSGCFSVSHWFSSFGNLALNIFVLYPMIAGMAILKFALESPLYDMFQIIVSLWTSLFTEIFRPWFLLIAPLGVGWAWIKAKGALQPTVKAVVWAISIFGIMTWVGSPDSMVQQRANNFVTEFTTSAAAKVAEFSDPGSLEWDSDEPTRQINEALWHGIPYQTWLMGEVGEKQARVDTQRETDDLIGWGPAILNGMYAADDEQGRKVVGFIQLWNSLSYAKSGDNTKTDAWTSDKGRDSWGNIPFLYHVKLMCHDTEAGTSESGEPENNKWMYGNSCDSAKAQTSSMVPFFQGEAYNEQLIAAVAGGFSTLAVMIAIIGAAGYLCAQKMIFSFMLLFAPIFLTAAAVGDEKRKRFAYRYGELMMANIVKQCIAVLMVLFVANSMATLLASGDHGIFIPWLLKPVAAFFFLIAMILFLFPMMSIVKAVAKGDTSVIDKTAAAPAKAAKAVGKGVAMGVAVAGTGGLAGGVAGAGKAASMLTTAGRMAGNRGGVGKLLTTTGRGLHLRDTMADALAQREGAKNARSAGVEAMLSGTSGERYLAGLKSKKGMIDPKTGKLTKAGQKQAERDYLKTVTSGANAKRAAALQNEYMTNFFAGHKERTGQYHALDPRSPENLKAAQVQAAQERQEINEEAVHARKRKSAEGGATAATVGPDGSVIPQGAPTEGGKTASATSGPQSLEAAKAGFAANARQGVDGPMFARNANLIPEVEKTGQQVLAGAGLNRDQVVADPSLLLTGNMYKGGDTTAMNPLHPATAHLNAMRFAMAHGDEEGSAAAMAKAAAAIAEHGVPDQISGISAKGAAAANFSPVSVVGSMPTKTATTWQQRAYDASTMQAAAASLPAGHPATDVVRGYVAALSNPAVKPGEVEGLKFEAIRALENAPVGANPVAPKNAAFAGPEATAKPVVPGAASVPAGAATAQGVATATQAAGTATAVEDRPLRVNGVPLPAGASLTQLDSAVSSMPEDHPARQSYDNLLSVLSAENTTPEQVSAARKDVFDKLALDPSMTQASSVPVAPAVSGGSASAASIPVPEGFRPAAVTSADGNVVRGIVPVDGAQRASAPAGFELQSVVAENGRAQKLFVASETAAVQELGGESAAPAVATAPGVVAAAQGVEATGSRTTAPAVQVAQATPVATTPSAPASAAAEASAPATSNAFATASPERLREVVNTLPAEHPAQASMQAYEAASSAGNVNPARVEEARQAVVNDLVSVPSTAPAAETTVVSPISTGGTQSASAHQVATATNPMVESPAPTTAVASERPMSVSPALVTMEASHRDLGRAVDTLPSDHPAQAAFATYTQIREEQGLGAPTESARREVLSALGVTSETGPVTFGAAPVATPSARESVPTTTPTAGATETVYQVAPAPSSAMASSSATTSSGPASTPVAAVPAQTEQVSGDVTEAQTEATAPVRVEATAPVRVEAASPAQSAAPAAPSEVQAREAAEAPMVTPVVNSVRTERAHVDSPASPVDMPEVRTEPTRVEAAEVQADAVAPTRASTPASVSETQSEAVRTEASAPVAGSIPARTERTLVEAPETRSEAPVPARPVTPAEAPEARSEVMTPARTSTSSADVIATTETSAPERVVSRVTSAPDRPTRVSSVPEETASEASYESAVPVERPAPSSISSSRPELQAEIPSDPGSTHYVPTRENASSAPVAETVVSETSAATSTPASTWAAPDPSPTSRPARAEREATVGDTSPSEAFAVAAPEREASAPTSAASTPRVETVHYDEPTPARAEASAADAPHVTSYASPSERADRQEEVAPDMTSVDTGRAYEPAQSSSAPRYDRPTAAVASESEPARFADDYSGMAPTSTSGDTAKSRPEASESSYVDRARPGASDSARMEEQPTTGRAEVGSAPRRSADDRPMEAAVGEGGEPETYSAPETGFDPRTGNDSTFKPASLASSSRTDRPGFAHHEEEPQEDVQTGSGWRVEPHRPSEPGDMGRDESMSVRSEEIVSTRQAQTFVSDERPTIDGRPESRETRHDDGGVSAIDEPRRDAPIYASTPESEPRIVTETFTVSERGEVSGGRDDFGGQVVASLDQESVQQIARAVRGEQAGTYSPFTTPIEATTPSIYGQEASRVSGETVARNVDSTPAPSPRASTPEQSALMMRDNPSAPLDDEGRSATDDEDGPIQPFRPTRRRRITNWRRGAEGDEGQANATDESGEKQ